MQLQINERFGVESRHFYLSMFSKCKNISHILIHVEVESQT